MNEEEVRDNNLGRDDDESRGNVARNVDFGGSQLCGTRQQFGQALTRDIREVGTTFGRAVEKKNQRMAVLRVTVPVRRLRDEIRVPAIVRNPAKAERALGDRGNGNRVSTVQGRHDPRTGA